MGEIADDIINGFQCIWCGVCFEREHGYPVACESCWQYCLEDGEKPGDEGMISGIQKATLKELG